MARFKKVTRGKGTGKVFTPGQLKDHMGGHLLELGRMLKEYMLAEAEKGGRHRLRRDGQGSLASSTVEVTQGGFTLHLPEHAQYVDSGRRPGTKKVPISALIKWIKRYRIVGRDPKSGKYRKAAPGSVNATAFAIQQAIFKKGIKARPFLEKTLAYGEELVAALVDEVLIPEIATVLEFQLKQQK